MIPITKARNTTLLRRPRRRAIMYAQSEPSTIRAATLETVMIRLLQQRRGRHPPVLQASEKLSNCGGQGNESGVWYACSVVLSAIAISRKKGSSRKRRRG